MGTYLSLLVRKRPREDGSDDASSAAGCSASHAASLPPSSLSHLLRSLRYRCASPSRIGSEVCRSVAEDEATRRTYGCHAHVYETDTVDGSHGVALAWRVDEFASPLSALSLLSLCRVANSCRKKTLVTTPKGEAVVLAYAAAL
ncbi:hypothetical protein CGC20_6105 [Leishmania donovani]|uniref:Uncharacterized protein n=3 Tax=Leishmania donovani species complex TaxID=38574 RepID=A4I635_LEIIN|nr:conserved hypothetical protein [Leishmania infantum JPCM5]AYU81150.1 hypothetical protein LdCL_300040600 [Leishmania donovani]CAC9516095.1 hypothetical_protein_-_conserved [Leishmania infantum]TPP43187.1 hypothetical protein CGC20_6105 [Leishmania donovani]CAM70257.1 conserved hypothetical protein [Leishmania infantum JPCM5]SUZ44169.1 hypothetical_protein_-_conserved [Leishmania infantum]|eukprot:XP_001467204.1 conserved hypothetical protein [Leishmania infantum JPCM5]